MYGLGNPPRVDGGGWLSTRWVGGGGSKKARGWAPTHDAAMTIFELPHPLAPLRAHISAFDREGGQGFVWVRGHVCVGAWFVRMMVGSCGRIGSMWPGSPRHARLPRRDTLAPCPWPRVWGSSQGVWVRGGVWGGGGGG